MAHQPNYAPYLGYLHKAANADVFILQDDLKYVKNDWGNRNRVQSEDSWRWLTLPVHAKTETSFSDARAAAPRGTRRRAPRLAGDRIAQLFAEFEIAVPITLESGLDLGPFENPNDRLIALCRRFDCDRYLSGTGGKAYIEEDRWDAAGITLQWSDYEAIPYDRGNAPWIPHLSTLDAIAHADDLLGLIA